jgi:hypothetical protein
VNAAINMTFRRKIDYGVAPRFYGGANSLTISDVGVDKTVAGILGDISEIVEVAGVSQSVKVDNA